MIDFGLDEEQERLRAEVLRFAGRELNDGILERDRAEVFPRELWLQCGRLGLPGLPVPEAYGGSGLDASTTAVAYEALGRGCRDGGLVFSLGAHLGSCVAPIVRHGSEEQKRRLLPGLCDGTLVAAHGMTEADSGSDAFAMRTRAVPDGEGAFRIDGVKTFVTNAPVADLFLVFAVTDPAKGFFGGITAFLLPRGTPGLATGPPIAKMGLKTSPMSEVVLQSARAGPETILGGVGGGAAVFDRGMAWERTVIFASHVGTMERLLDTAVSYARERHQGGQPIGKFQAVAHRIAGMKVRLEAARLLVRQAAWRLDQGSRAGVEAAVAKLYVGEALVETARDAVATLGGYGYMVEFEVERALRDAVAATIYSGTSDVQRNVIARSLGL